MACKRDIKQVLTDKVVELSKTNSRESVNSMFKTEVIKPSGRVFIPNTLVEQYWDNMKFTVSLSPLVIKEGVQELFESNPELASIGTQKQYSSYLNTIFPESKVKDIVYRSGSITSEEFDNSEHTPSDYMDLGEGLYLTPNKKYAEFYGTARPAVVNIVRPKDSNIAKEERINYGRENNTAISPKLDENGKYDGIVDMSQNVMDSYELVVFKPEQIHILGSKQDIKGFKKWIDSSIDLTPTPVSPNIDNLKSATEAEIGRLRQEKSRLKQAATVVSPDDVNADAKIAELFRRQQDLENRIETLLYRKDAYANYDFDMLQDAFDGDKRRLEYLMRPVEDLKERLRNIKEAQRIVDYYSEIGDFSRESNFLFDDTAAVPDGVRTFFQGFANEVEPFNAEILSIQKEIIVQLTKSIPTIKDWVESKQIELSYDFLTKPVKDKDWISMQVLSSEDNYASDQILIVDVLITMAQEYEDAAIKQRREVIEKLDGKIKAIIGKHKNYDVFKQLDKDGEFTGNIIMPFAQFYYDNRKEIKSKKYDELRELRKKPALSAAEVKRVKKLSKEIKEWELENEIMIDPRKLPEVQALFPEMVSEYGFTDSEKQDYKNELLSHLNQKGYDSYVEKTIKHIKEYKLLEDYMQSWAEEDLTDFTQSLSLKPGIVVNGVNEAMRIWKALHSPIYAVADHNTLLPLTINVGGQTRTLSEITNIKDSHYRFTESVPRRSIGKIDATGLEYKVTPTNKETGYYDSRYATIEADEALYDFWYFAIHNLSLAKQMMPYKFQREYQVNTVLYMEKGLMEQLTTDGAFETIYSRAWDGIVQSLTDNDLSTESYSEDPFGGRERNINYNFLGTRQQLEDKLFDKKLIEYFVTNNIDATSVQDARTKGLLTPERNKEITKLRKDAKKEIAEKASFDLGSVLKFYLGSMVALNHKENILPVLNNIEATIGTIKKAQTNRQGNVMTENGALKGTDLPIVNAIDRVAYQLDVYTGQPTQVIEGTSSKTMLTKEDSQIVSQLEKLKENATDAQKEAIQKLIEGYGSKLTGSGTMDTVLSYLRFRGLGWNVSAQVANWSAGYFANFTMAADARIVKTSALQRAYNIFWHIAMPSFLSSAVNRETSSKIKNLMYKGDFLLDATSEMQKSRFKSDSTLSSKLDWLSPYMPTRVTEYMNQGTLVVARLMSVKVPKDDGTMSTLYDALDENLNIKPEFSGIAEDYNWGNGGLMAKETTLIRKLIKDTHGDYSEMGKQYAKRKVAGRMAMFFKTWLPNAMKVRFGAEKFDPIYNIETKGRYKSYTPGTAALTGATIGTWFAPGIGTAVGYGIGMAVAKLWGNDVHGKNIAEDFKDSFTGIGMLMKRLVYSKLRHFNPAFADKLDTQFGNFSDVDAANLRANLQELQFMLTLLLVYLLAKAVLFDDDEDKKGQVVHNYLINQIVKVQGDLMFYTSPQTPGNLMEQIIPVSKLVNQSFGLINSANKAIYNVELTGNEDTFGENLRDLFPKPMPSGKTLERVYNEPALLKKLFEE